MTRVNSSIQVESLTDEHLLAEHREIKRLPYCLKRSINSGSINRIPNEFTLGKGHILFFLDKMKFIFERYLSIYNECINRGFNVQNYSDNFSGIDFKYYNDYSITEIETSLLKNRIIDRILNGRNKRYHYYGNIITKEQACNLLTNGNLYIG